MAKAFRYLLVTGWANLAAIPITALVITMLTAISGAPMKTANFFSTYFVALPLICLLFLFIYGSSLCSTSLHIALSLGCRRKDFFGALCGMLLVYTGVAWAVRSCVLAVPALFSWSLEESMDFLFHFPGGSVWLYPLLGLCCVSMGCLCGLVITRSRKLGAILFAFAMILVLAIMVAAGIVGIFALYVPVFSTLARWLWVLCVAVILGCLLLVRRQIFRFVVK